MVPCAVLLTLKISVPKKKAYLAQWFKNNWYCVKILRLGISFQILVININLNWAKVMFLVLIILLNL
jgi:hypothetical protein